MILKKSIRHVLFVFGGLVALLIAAGLVTNLFYGRTSPPPLPNPNGYDDLTEAGQAVTGNLDDISDWNPDSLRTLVDANAEALRLLRVLPVDPCQRHGCRRIAPVTASSG